MPRYVTFRSIVIQSLFCLLIAKASAQTQDADTLDVVNWNLEYFASGNPLNAATQVRDTRQIMNALNADIYAICEVVNVDSFQHLAASLNGSYNAVVSSFASGAASASSPDYPAAQKLGFIYRTSMVRNIVTRALLGSSSTAYYDFSSGRFPFLVSAEVLGRDNQWRAISFIVMHAKAQSDATSCSRRIAGCEELKDTLDHQFINTAFLLLGDYNDDLDISICSSAAQSNYEPLVADSTHYHALTLPISKAGAFSIDGYPSLIDHVIASNAMNRYYVPGSAQSLRLFVKNLIPTYDNDVSDHFPVRTQYVLDTARQTGITILPEAATDIYPQPAIVTLNIRSSAAFSRYELLTISGRLIQYAQANEIKTINLSNLSAGLYILHLYTADGHRTIQKVVIGR